MELNHNPKKIFGICSLSLSGIKNGITFNRSQFCINHQKGHIRFEFNWIEEKIKKWNGPRDRANKRANKMIEYSILCTREHLCLRHTSELGQMAHKCLNIRIPFIDLFTSKRLNISSIAICIEMISFRFRVYYISTHTELLGRCCWIYFCCSLKYVCV